MAVSCGGEDFRDDDEFDDDGEEDGESGGDLVAAGEGQEEEGEAEEDEGQVGHEDDQHVVGGVALQSHAHNHPLLGVQVAHLHLQRPHQLPLPSLLKVLQCQLHHIRSLQVLNLCILLFSKNQKLQIATNGILVK